MATPSNELVQCLLATLRPEADVRHQAEGMLREAAKREGYCVGLIAVLQAGEQPVGVRQLAAVILRRHIQENWAPEDNLDENGGPSSSAQISDAEKVQVRALLPGSLADPNTRIQTAVGMAIAEIGKADCPHRWPELLPGLANAITSGQNNPTLVAGALRCLAMLIEDLSEIQVVEIAPIVLPELLQILHTPSYSSLLQRQALGVFKCTLGSLELTHTQVPAATAILDTSLQQWLQTILSVLQTPPTADSEYVPGLHYDALGCLLVIVASFRRRVVSMMPAVLSACWGLFVAYLPLYEELVIGQEEERGSPGEEDATLDHVSLSDVVSQLFEVLLTFLGNSKLLAAMSAALPQLAYLTIGYMQIPEENALTWEQDVNTLLCDEEEQFWGARASGTMLFDELSSHARGMNAIGEAVQRRTIEAAAARESGVPGWWKVREAVLLAVGAVATCLSLKGKKAHNWPLDPTAIASSLLAEELATLGSGNKSIPGLLVGRALWLLSKLADVLPPPITSAAIRAACQALAPGNPGPVQAGACQALAVLVVKGAEDVHAVSDGAFHGLTAMLGAATEDSLHLVIEAMTALVSADPLGAARWEPHITPAALQAWVQNYNDPLIGKDAEQLLRVLAHTPGCLGELQQRAMPTLCNVVTNPAPHAPLLVSACIYFMTTLLQASKDDVTAAGAACAVAMPPTMHLLSMTDEEEVQASATAYLKTALQVGGATALSWTGLAPQAAAANFIDIALKLLLLQETTDLGCSRVGDLLLELLRHASEHVVPRLQEILNSIATRLGTADHPRTVQSLVTLLAFVARADTNSFISALAPVEVAPAVVSPLQRAMQKWTERQMEMQTPYDIRVTTCALGSLLLCPHPALDTVIVRGKRIDTGGGIRTRARLKSVQEEEQWTEIPLRLKLITLLTDAYIENTIQNPITGGDGPPEEEKEEEEWIDEEDGSLYCDDDGSSDESSGGGLFDEYGMLRAGLDGTDVGDVALGQVDVLESSRRRLDPLNTVNIAEYVAEVFRKLAQTSPSLLQAAASELTPVQTAALERIWQ